MAALDYPLKRKRFTRAEAEEVQKLFPGQRFELIDGELVDKMGQNPPHAFMIQRLTALLGRLFGSRIRVQLSMEAAQGERNRTVPEPDLAVLREDLPEYRTRHPHGDEVQLLIEVSDTTLGFDANVKSGIYARAEVAEYWVVDLNRREVMVHRSPRDGQYCEIRKLSGTDPLPLESAGTNVAQLFE